MDASQRVEEKKMKQTFGCGNAAAIGTPAVKCRLFENCTMKSSDYIQLKKYRLLYGCGQQ